MEAILKIVAWITTHGPSILSALVAAITALIALFALIPGDQPEKALQGFVDFIKKFSKK